ncbi:hypothetical protein B484DRAFT_466781 [Ochromonadaceae sp. CCMP2298]|nr:hypothetical protein B484DRAFT_466781 [Ochromonadaceae sp. CCMP2298]
MIRQSSASICRGGFGPDPQEYTSFPLPNSVPVAIAAKQAERRQRKNTLHMLDEQYEVFRQRQYGEKYDPNHSTEPRGGGDGGWGAERSAEAQLACRREAYVRLFMRSDVVISSPLTRAVQTACAAMWGHSALTKNDLTLYSIIREVKRPGGLDTIGTEVGGGILRRAHSELQQTVGRVDSNDANIPWWSPLSSFETEREQRDRIVEFVTYSRYCPHKLPVFVGHSLFFKAFYSKRVSAPMQQERPLLCSNLKKYRLANATLLAVTVRSHPITTAPGPTSGSTSTPTPTPTSTSTSTTPSVRRAFTRRVTGIASSLSDMLYK